MFDPYRKWLGIPPKDQPPHHYRLLGVEPFESDLDVIEGAAEQKMNFVRQYQSGEHAADAARILNELATARLCLLKPATKAAYDDKLRKQLTPAESEPQFPELPLSFSDDAPVSNARKTKAKLARRQPPVSPQLLMAGGAVAALCIVALFVVMNLKGRTAASKAVSGTNVAADKLAPAAIEVAPAKSISTDDAQFSAYVWKESKLAAEPAGPAIDLMPLVDLKRDVTLGKWESTSSALIGDRRSELYLPVELPEDYQLKFTVRRTEGTDTLYLGFLMGGRMGTLVLDGWGSAFSGIYVDGREPNSDCTTRPGGLFRGTSTGTIVMTIHPEHFHASFDGETVVDWFGNSNRLIAQGGNRECPMIGTFDARYVLESASLVPIKPEPAPNRMPRLDRELDLLPLVDVDRDVQRGIWAINKNVLYSPEEIGKIYLPTVVPEEYTVSVTAELPTQHRGDYSFTIGLVAQKAYFQFVSGGSDTGLELIDGRRWNGNETRLAGPLLKPGLPAKIDCTVLNSGIRVDVDGKTLIDWRGDTRRLSMQGEWALANGRRLSLGNWHHLKVRAIKIGPPLANPKEPEHPPLSIGTPLDLLTLVDTERDTFGGTWEQDGTALLCRGDVEYNKLAIPLECPDEYKLTMRVSRMEGGKHNNESLILGLPIGQATAVLAVDGHASTLTAPYLDYVHLPDFGQPYRGTVIPAGTTREIVVHVRTTGLQVTSDGTSILDWKGHPGRCWVPTGWVAPARRLLLGGWNQGFRFEKLQLEPLPKSSFPAVLPLGFDGKLLPILNVERDSRKGDWKLDGDSLITPPITGARLQIPVPVPERYVFSTTVERTGEFVLYLGLVVGGHPCPLAIDGLNRTQAGLDPLDGHRYFHSSNLTGRKYPEPMLPPSQRVQLRCFVLPDTVVVTCGDKELVRWHGDPRRLSALPDFTPPNDSEVDWTHLWLGNWGAGFIFRDVELRPLSNAEADQLSKSFTGVFPTTSQAEVPLRTIPSGALFPPGNP